MLYYGAEWLVKGSSGLAGSLGIRPMIIGLTVVAFGTSVPELVVSVMSSFQGKSMMALGNVIGSNISNIALVLGLAAILNPVPCLRSVIRRDIPIMLGVSFYLLLLTLDLTLGRIEGATLAAGILLYLYFTYWISLKGSVQKFDREETAQGIEPNARGGSVPSRARQVAMVIAGIACVVIGAEAVVKAAVKAMDLLCVSEKFIGLTMVAVGTSLPELATSVTAAVKKEMDISVGNLVGSNVFNILGVLGTAALVRPIPIPEGLVQSGLLVDIGVMILTGVLPWIMLVRSCTLTRKDGLLLLLCYGGYVLYLVVSG